jgi:hypothetical protein
MIHGPLARIGPFHGAAKRQYMAKVRGLGPIGYWPLDEASGTVARNLGTLGATANGAYTGVTFHNPGANLLTNGGFDPDTAGWTPGSSGTLASVAGGQPGNALQVTNGGTAYGYGYQAVPVIPGVTYSLTYSHKNGTTTGLCWIGLTAGNKEVYDSGALNDANWTERTATFVATTSIVYLKCGNVTNVAGQTSLFDSVSVVPLSPNGIGDGKNAPYFDGVNDFVNIYSAALAAAFNGAEGTLMAWAKVSGAGVWTDGADRDIVFLAADSNNYLQIRRQGGSNNKIQFVRKAGGTFNTPVGALNLTTTDWIHLAFTWSETANLITAYSMGVATDAGVVAAQWGAVPASLARVGAHSTVPENPWSGTIAHVALFTRPLSPAQIASLARV